MVLLDDLLRNGYFPPQLPPSFNTETLANAYTIILPSINQDQKKWARHCKYSIPKVCYQRRLLGIPNPYSQLLICDIISNKWADLNGFMLKSRFSLSRAVIDINGERALKRRNNFPDLLYERIKRSIGYKYLLYTDISRFYSTIYTHSIPWALHTKLVAKSNKGPALYGNTIDKFVRWANDGQTTGIPIGPDTSLLISEIIGTAIDEELKNKINNFKGFRYVDDFYLYFKTKQEAENALTILQNILREYELETNEGKTKIVELPEILLDPWVAELSQFNFRNTISGQKTDIMRYFSKAFELSKKYSDKYVMRYAISRIKELLVKPENWPIYESLLMQSAIGEPGSLSFVSKILLAYQANPNYSVDTTKIKKTITELIKIVTQMNDSVSALIILDMNNVGLIPHGRLNTSNWQNLMTGLDLYNENWLLSYEALIKGWLPSNVGYNYISRDNFFSLLELNNVSFYDTTRQIEPVELKEPIEEIRPIPRIIEGEEITEQLRDQLELILQHYEY